MMFHPKPHQNDNETNWCVFSPNKTVVEARKYENKKYNGLEIRGYKILTIWEDEYKKNKNIVVEKCVSFITN